MFEDKVAVITGGAGGIGRETAEAFRRQGAHVAVIDMEKNEYFTGDIGKQTVLESFAEKVLRDFGHVDFLVNNAMKSQGGMDTCSYEAFQYALQVGVTAPFYLTKLFSDHLGQDASIVNISSTRAFMSQPNTESYSAAKGGITALTHAMAVTLAGKARVNAIAPGWIDTQNSCLESADQFQHPVKRVGIPKDIADMVLFLCSEHSGFITGQTFTVDGGMTRQMIYHNDCGWQMR